MKIPEAILTQRLQQEVALYEEQLSLYESSKQELYDAQLAYLSGGGDEAQFAGAIAQNAKYYDRVQKLQAIIEQLIEQLEVQRAQAPLLDTKTLYHVPQAEQPDGDEQQESAFVYRKMPVGYKAFRKMFLAKIKEEKRVQQELEAAAIKKDKTIHYPVTQYKMIEDNTREIQENAEFRRKLKQALKDHTPVEENVYLERRKQEQKKVLDDFLKKHQSKMKQKEEDAKQFAREIAKRELEFHEKIQQEERSRKEIERKMAVSTKAQRTITKITSDQLENAVAQEYMPEHLRRHVSLRADKVVPANFGLGLCQNDKFVPEIQQEGKVEVKKVGSMQEVLGVQTQGLVFRNSVSNAKRPQSRGQDKKKSGKASQLSTFDDMQDDSSDDYEPVQRLPVERQIAKKSKALPVIKSNPAVEATPETAKLTTTLFKTLQPIRAESSFVCQPERLDFCNFRPNVSQTLTFTVTNCGSDLQAFRILEVEEQYRDMFEVVYTPGGMLAPGTSVKVTVIFTYKDMNQYDIENVSTALQIKHKSAVTALPVFCYKETFRIRIFDQLKDATKEYKFVMRNELANFQNEDATAELSAAHAASTCLVNGRSGFGYYFVNSGSVGVSARYEVQSIQYQQQVIPALKDSELASHEAACAQYESALIAAQAQLRAQFAQFQAEQQAAAEKKKLKIDKNAVQVTENFESVTEENLEDFVARRSAEIAGERPEQIDPLRRSFKSLVGFGADQLLYIRTPECVFLDNQEFDAQAYKAAVKTAFMEQRRLQIQQKIDQEVQNQQQLQMQSIDLKKKRPATPPPGALNFMLEDVRAAYSKEQLEGRMRAEEEQFQADFIYQQHLLKFSHIDDGTIGFFLPAKSVVYLPLVHQPRTAEFKQFDCQQQFALYNGRGDCLQQYKLIAHVATFTSPIQLENDTIDFQTCFYGDQYNALFKIILVNQDQNQDFKGLKQDDPSTVSRKLHITIPQALKQFISVDQNDIILNFKNNSAEPKLQLNFPDKKSVLALTERQNEIWSGIEVQSDLFAESNTMLGQDLQEMKDALKDVISKVKECEAATESTQADLEGAEKQLDELKALKLQIEQSGGKMKPPKGMADQDELERRVLQLQGVLNEKLQASKDFALEIARLKAELDSKDFVGSYIQLQFKIQLEIFNQPELLYLTIRVRLTNCGLSVFLGDEISTQHKLRLQTPVPAGQFIKFDLQARNNSALPQHVGLVSESTQTTNLNFQWCAEPAGGLLYLQPGETCAFAGLFKLDCAKQFAACFQIAGEFGSAVNLTVEGRSFKPQLSLELKNKDAETKEIALHDCLQVPLVLENAGPRAKWVVAPSLASQLRQCDWPVRFLPASGVVERRQNIILEIDADVQKTAKLLRLLESQEQLNSQNADSASQQAQLPFIREYLPRDGRYYIEINIQLCNDAGTPPSVLCYRFILCQPVVCVAEIAQEAQSDYIAPLSGKKNQAKTSRPTTPTAQTKQGQPKGAQRERKGAKQVEREPEGELEVAPLAACRSRAVVDFGRCPVGQKAKKQVRIEAERDFYTLEHSVEYYDAQLTMLSFLTPARPQRAKILTFQYLPARTEAAAEEIVIGCYADAACTQKLNDLHFELRGQGVQIQMQVSLVNQLVCKPQETGVLEHFLPPLQLHAAGEVQLHVKSLIDFKFAARVRQEGENECVKYLIVKQNVALDQQVQTVVIKYQAVAYSQNRFESTRFYVESGDFRQQILLHAAVVCGAVDAVDGIRIVNGQFEAAESTDRPAKKSVGERKERQ